MKKKSLQNLTLMLFLIIIVPLGFSGRAWGAELLTNGGFEDVSGTPLAPDNWEEYPGTATMQVATDPVHNGTYAASLTKEAAGTTCDLHQEVGITAGESYTFSGYGYIDSSATQINYIKLRIKWLPGGDTDDESVILYKGDNDDTWVALSVTADAPANQTSAEVQCYASIITPGSAIPVYFDDVSFQSSYPGPDMMRAVAADTSGLGAGIQSGDTVTIYFDLPTNVYTINSGNIDTVLALNNGHIWGNINSATWSAGNTMLTINLAGTGSPSVASGDTITIDADTIEDVSGNDAHGSSPAIAGSFDPSPYVGLVLINEVCTDPQQDWTENEGGDGTKFNSVPGTGTVSDTDEYIEMYNNYGSPVDLSSWTMEMTDGSPEYETIGSHSSTDTYFSLGGTISDFRDGEYFVLGNPSGSLSNDIMIVLKDDVGRIVDSVTLGSYDDGDTTDNAPSGNASDATDEVVARDASSTNTDVDSVDFAQKSASPGETNYFTGVVDITSGALYGLADMANVKVTDSDLNTDANSQQTTPVTITSSVPGSSSITLTLKETDNNTGIFDARTQGTLLGVTTGGSTGNLIQVTDGCTITATYIDAEPSGTRTDTATYRSYVIRINEVAFKESSDFDWIELYCVNDGNSGNGVDINNLGLYLEDDDTGDTRLHKTFRSGITMKTGDYLVAYSALDSSMAATFLNVEEGDSIVIQGRYDGATRGPSIIIDGGRIEHGATVLDYLQREGIGTGTSALELMIATHPDADHIGSLGYILGQRDVKWVWNSGFPGTTPTYTNFITAIENETYEEDDVTYSCTHTIPPTVGATYNISRAGNDYGVNVKVLNNRNTMPYSDSNASSIVTQVSYENVSFMLTGDAESSVCSSDESRRVEERMIDTYGISLTSDILKTGHHGSASTTSDNFLTYVDPDIAIVSVGGNVYGHPAAEHLDRLTAKGIPYYCTATGTRAGAPAGIGDIPIYTNGLTWYWDEASAGSDGVINTYYTRISLIGTDEQVVLKDGDGNIIDAVCWADDAALTDTEQEDVTNIYNANEWNNNTGASCIDSDTVSTSYSIGRYPNFVDSNSKSNWEVYTTPTPGTKNEEETPPTDISGLGVNNDPFLSDGSDLSRRDTSIFFYLTRKSEVTIRMCDGRGRNVRTLGDRVVLVRGNHIAKWDGKNDSGDSVPIGTYIIEVSAVATDESGTDTEEISVTVAKSLSGGGSGGCFIATAAYTTDDGRPFASLTKTIDDSTPLSFVLRPSSLVPQLKILRRFRDECLLTNSLGRAFVSTYYGVSPPVAEFISDKKALKAVVRNYLKPIVWLIKKE